MKRVSLTISLSVSFPTTVEFDNLSLLSSVVLLGLSYFSLKTLTFCRKSRLQQTPLSSSSEEDNCCKDEVLIENSSIPTTTIAVEGAVELPDDAWVEVLCRLPPKDMVRFKSVSKTWNSLISDLCIPKITSPLYGLFLRTGSPRTWDFACCVDGTGTNNNGIPFVKSCFRTLPFTPLPKFFFDCSNGFLLFFDIHSRRFYVGNPSTQQYLALPKAPEKKTPNTAFLTFTPHFNVVWVVKNPCRVIIYNSETRKWVVHRELVVHSKCRVASYTRSVLIGGLLYLLTTTGCILELDSQNISARVFELPKVVIRGAIDMGCIGVSANNFHYAWVDRNTHHLFVWVADGRKWVLKHSFSLLELAKYSMPGICEDLTSLAPYSFHPASDVLFLGHDVGIFRYDPISKQLDCVYRLENGKSIRYGQVQVYPFTRSLMTMHDFIPSIKKKQRGVKKSGTRAT